jgi:exonuclease SbcD
VTDNATRPIRIAHFADTHLGYRALYRSDPVSGRNQRAIDVERAYAAAIDDILAREIDLIIHAGDVFHHTRPSWQAMRVFVSQTRRIEAAGIPALFIAGNHDTPRLRTTGSVFSVLDLALPGIRFVADYDMEEVEYPDLGLRVHAIPHGALTNPNLPMPFPEDGVRNVIVTHGLVPGIQLKGGREPGEEELGGQILQSGFDYIALGHYHLWGPHGDNAWYSGSTERTGWGDEQVTPGYNLVTLEAPGTDPVIEHIEIPARPMETLPPVRVGERSAREIADQILEKAATMRSPEAMLRVQLLDAPRSVRREVETILKRESGEVVWSLTVYSPADILAPFGTHEGGVQVGDVRTLFARFVAEREEKGEYDPAFAAAFKTRGLRALDEAVQAADAQATADLDQIATEVTA